MGRKPSSQWDFGDLFPSDAGRDVLTVAELTSRVKNLLERQWASVWVTGEVTNLRLQGSGHVYFTLKDPDAQLSCVLFRGTDAPQRALIEDGRYLIVQGELTVYAPRGQYQLVVRRLEVQGVGALQAAFERLKQRLQAQGWFAPERRRPVPRYPQRVGIVTSASGAALRDVLHVASRRHPRLEWVLAPCRVQGTGAAAEIAEAIRTLNEWSSMDDSRDRRLDLVLVTRGGGSLEDLWAFNEEEVARAVHESALPVVSAVGHEVDFTICDFVADLRAATPSAAAEIITEGVHSSRKFIAEAPGWMVRSIGERLAREEQNLRRVRDRMARTHPRRRLNERLQRLDDLRETVLRVARHGWEVRQARWDVVQTRWRGLRAQERLRARLDRVDECRRRLLIRWRQRLHEIRTRLVQAERNLQLLSPQAVLDRGYSITTDVETGIVIRDASTVFSGQLLRTRVRRGEFESRVEQ